jgi:L-cystine uptake protein TcyP (sodium:dicarboxylate symporter family)
LISIVVVAEPVVAAIVDEAGFFPCFKAIIAQMTHITANFTRHVYVHILGGFHVGRCLQFLHEEVHLSGDHVGSIDLVYTVGTGLETISIPTLIWHHALD